MSLASKIALAKAQGSQKRIPSRGSFRKRDAVSCPILRKSQTWQGQKKKFTREHTRSPSGATTARDFFLDPAMSDILCNNMLESDVFGCIGRGDMPAGLGCCQQMLSIFRSQAGDGVWDSPVSCLKFEVPASPHLADTHPSPEKGKAFYILQLWNWTLQHAAWESYQQTCTIARSSICHRRLKH